MPGRILPLFSIAVIALVATSATAATNQDSRTYEVRGVVRAPFADGTITIDHEAIPGFMPAMTMPFFVDEAEVGSLVPGDRVVFDFVVGDRSRATRFRRIGKAEVNAPAVDRSAGSSPARRARLREGDAVPEFKLVDQDGRPFTTSELDGRQTLITFIFTRCPVPEFCPLIAQKMQAVQRQVSDEDVRFVSVTLDPEHDRPAVLREYARSLEADFARWRFVTGEFVEIEKLTRAFAVHVQQNGASLDHTLATALIGPDGRVQQIWRGNFWKPEEVVAALKEAAASL